MSQQDPTYLKYWLGFNLVKGIGPAKLSILLERFGSIRDAWNASRRELELLGLDRKSIESLEERRNSLNLGEELAKVEKIGASLLTWDSPDYPRYLREIPNSPPLLYVRGELKSSDQWALAVVGTRRLTTYGRQVTRELVSDLVRNQVTIISGLAKGIDAEAHKSALDAGGRTIAVLGSGVNYIYPSEHRSLAQRIVSGRGAILSDYPLGTAPESRNFPPRNRIISGLSMGVLVIEAGERSGALITAEFGLEQDREIFAVPGNINSPASKGTNRLIKQGAKLVQNVDDILEELNLALIPEHIKADKILPDSPEEAILLDHLSRQPTHIDELTRQAGLPTSLVSSTLTMMELKGMVQQVGAMNYVVVRESDPDYEYDSSTLRTG
ncbi:MAG: DNA-processing protein DprA [Anaerolineae bacterium]|nr:MAG: DNA-processing protein DprA [Anaerolineae bacterium]